MTQFLIETMIIFRKRTLKRIFHEFLVCMKNGELCQLDALPSRYANRVISQFSIYGTPAIEVNSSPFPICEFASIEKIERGTGVWISQNDCVKKGHYSPEQVSGRAQYFSVHIDATTCMMIDQASCILKDESPTVLYHGTSRNNVYSILKQGLKPTIGMLGYGIYFGTFWKATRYACLTSNYSPQKGCVVRVYAFPENLVELPDGKWKCQCGCTVPEISDHFNVHQSDIHLSQSNSTKGQVKNEEWLIKSPVFLQEWAGINESSFPSPHYDPLFRGTKIE